MSASPPSLRGLLSLLAGAACIGFAPLWVRWSEVGPVATAFHRLLLALPFLALWSVRERPRSQPHPRSRPGETTREVMRSAVWPWVFGAGIGFALDLSAWHLSIRYTTVADATLLTNLAPIFVTLGAWVLLGERVGRRFGAGMVVALIGAWLLTGASLRVDPARWRGAVFGVVPAVFYGCYQICVARLRREWPAGRLLLWSSVISTPVLAMLAVSAGEMLWRPSLRGWLVVAALAVTAQVMGQGLITYGFAHLPAGYSSLTLLFQPLVATAAGWWLLGEPVSGGQAMGGAILLGGMWLASRDPGAKHRKPKASTE